MLTFLFEFDNFPIILRLKCNFIDSKNKFEEVRSGIDFTSSKLTNVLSENCGYYSTLKKLII